MSPSNGWKYQSLPNLAKPNKPFEPSKKHIGKRGQTRVQETLSKSLPTLQDTIISRMFSTYSHISPFLRTSPAVIHTGQIVLFDLPMLCLHYLVRKLWNPVALSSSTRLVSARMQHRLCRKYCPPITNIITTLENSWKFWFCRISNITYVAKCCLQKELLSTHVRPHPWRCTAVVLKSKNKHIWHSRVW